MAEMDRKKMRFVWKAHKLLWNLSGGRLGRRMGGIPVLELVTTGHRSRLERQILIWYFDFPKGPAMIGTNAGRDVDPAWVKNLRANPLARARWGGRWHDVTAVELTGADYEAAWNAGVAASAGFAEYEQALTRPIPIVQLQPR
jgi:deazaflavin-dependent oxidoreductase (nitroreductase family)